jgi:hypothetical protein
MVATEVHEKPYLTIGDVSAGQRIGPPEREAAERLKVVEVIKPIIRAGQRALSRVVQKGIVVVEAASETEEE